MKAETAEVLAGTEAYVPAVAVINLDNLAENYAKIKAQVHPKTELIAVVKADSYGFGAVPVSKRLYREGCRSFFVAVFEEGLEIRENLPPDTTIFVLGGLLPGTEDLFVRHNLIPVLNNVDQSDLWLRHAEKLHKKLDAVLHIDTGIFRNGYIYRDFEKNVDDITKGLNVVLIMSHLACADIPDHRLNELQLARFEEVASAFKGVRKCFAATNGMFLGKEYFFDAVRPGKALYGFSVRKDKVGFMIPVMDVFSRIVQINRLNVGDSIGYGATFTADRDMTVVTAAIGYADGFMRKFSGFGHGFLGGKRMPVIGRISMDYTTFDASGVEESCLKIGNWVALTDDGDYTLEKWALELNTIPHEISCRFGRRVKKVYVGEVR
ncbi:MAG: alanine racemase [Holosporaceae bacterium]|nr:alanine racemase [Holosporaceae bacterium]